MWGCGGYRPVKRTRQWKERAKKKGGGKEESSIESYSSVLDGKVPCRYVYMYIYEKDLEEKVRSKD